MAEFRSCDMTKVKSINNLWSQGRSAGEGKFCWTTESKSGVLCLWVNLPYEETRLGVVSTARLPVYREGETLPERELPAWEWDGDMDRPTLKQSILRREQRICVHDDGTEDGGPTQWHGWVRAGNLVGA